MQKSSIIAVQYPSSLFVALLLGTLLQPGCAKKSVTPIVTDSSTAIVQHRTDSVAASADSAASTASAHAKRSDDTGTPGMNGRRSIQGNITISSPRMGERVSASGFRITGLARTFENSVSYRVSDTIAKVIIAEGHTTATGEMGTFNPYVIEVRPKRSGIKYPIQAVIEVFENSAKDGSEINRVATWVTIVEAIQ